MKKACEKLHHEDGGIVILSGPRGTGKTQMATELGLLWHRGKVLSQDGRSHSMQYSPLSDLYENEKAAWNRREGGNSKGPLAAAGACSFLVLDEIQDVMNSDWEKVQLTRLIDRRYAAVKRTVIITNLKAESMRKFLGESPWSRIRETGILIEMTGRNFRNTKGQEV